MANQQTKVIETLEIKGVKQTAAELVAKIDRPLGNAINGKQVGDEFKVTLTGAIEIREFNGVKGAYFKTKEGFSISVNASYDPSTHKADKVFSAICREFQPVNAKGEPDGTPRKFCAFVV